MRTELRILFCLLTITLSAPLHAAGDTQQPLPRISIIIDDIGYRAIQDRDALSLPGPLAYAIMPHSPLGDVMSELAGRNGKEVLLHLPMEAEAEDKNRFLGPGALTLNMSRQEFIRTLRDNLRSIPNMIGVNNHMGSLITSQPDHMRWLMQALQGSDYFYVDSVTTSNTVADSKAREYRVPYLRRDVFLDHVQSIPWIEKQFDRLIRTARENGQAIAIGHPHPETLFVLQRRLANLAREGVVLISLKRMLQRTNADPRPLQLSLHP